ncbi:acyl-CoA thioesterase [Gordonia sp. NPDC058843]|uniref:acyl-CoA thioesterase n=1 Tax=Gordonia sp. NPDC058843 TaxID=3346648 RepID=UPI0036A8CA40
MKQLSRQAPVDDGLMDSFGATPLSGGRWSATIEPTWWGWSGPHGGAIAALAVRVAAAAVPSASVRSADLRFVGKPDGGDLILTPSVREVGRHTRVVDVAVTQAGSEIATASVMAGRVGEPGPTDVVDRVAGFPGPEGLDPFVIPPEIVPMGAHLDLRPVDGPLPLTGASEPWMRAWISTRTPMVVDAAYLALLADCLPPAVFPTLTAPLALPTVTLSLHVTAPLDNATPAPVLVHTRNTSTSGGWSVDDTTLRDRDGRLLASARQSRRVLGWPVR